MLFVGSVASTQSNASFARKAIPGVGTMREIWQRKWMQFQVVPLKLNTDKTFNPSLSFGYVGN
jgi:hypothetical protein